MNRVEASGTSTDANAGTALRAALNQVMGKLGPQGIGPAQVERMVWTAEHPARFSLARREIDLALRESFAGFRPAIELRRGHGPLHVAAWGIAPEAPPAGVAWRGYDWAQLAAQYSPRSQVPSMQGVFDGWTRDGVAFRTQHANAAYDLVYGPGPNEALDLLYPDNPNPPLWIFIHGGYWQAADKGQHLQFAAGMLKAGYAVAMPNYELAPTIPLEAIVDQMRRSILFLRRNAAAFGFDGDRMHVSGHSAGGHLAAMMAADPALYFLKSSLLLSGIFDLRPLHMLPIHRVIGLTDADMVRRLSPCWYKPNPGVRIGVGVGIKESDEFRRQSDEIAGLWSSPPALHAEGRHHFDLLEDLRADSPLLRLALQTAA